MALEPTKHVNGRMWPPGVSGNPNGRPVGSRTVFSQSFLKDLASVWAERGRAAWKTRRSISPASSLQLAPDCPTVLSGLISSDFRWASTLLNSLYFP